jgi:abortive infection bacteriophage resistance protein
MEKIPYTKLYLTIQQQLEQLQSRGVAVTDLARAKRDLHAINYYRLSGYWYPMRKHELCTDGVCTPTEECIEGTNFEHIVSLYVFDKKLRLLMLDVLERIEISLRTDVARVLGAKHPCAHEHMEYFNQPTSVPHEQLEKTFATLRGRYRKHEQQAKNEFLKHFRRKYSGKPPIWVAVELWSFGTLSIVIEKMTMGDKREIASQYDINPEVLPSFIRTLAEARNICAHHDRLWNRTLTARPKTSTITNRKLVHLQDLQLAKIYFAVAIARAFQSCMTTNKEWVDDLKSLIEAFPTAPSVSAEDMGFPPKWQDMDIWK